MTAPKLRSVILRLREAAAIVAGRQTQIRRPAKEFAGRTDLDAILRRCPNQMGGPFGEPGDILVGREAYALEHSVEWDDEPPHIDGRPVKWRPESDVEGWIPRWTQAHYRATDPAPELAYEDSEAPGCRWRSPVTMPLEFARIRQPVLRVWVERAQDACIADALAQAIDGSDYSMAHIADCAPSVLGAYREAHESTYSPDSWDRNDWMWCCEFERHVQ